MNTELCRRLGIEFPLFAFSHCRDVVAEVSRAGGFGVLGAVGHTPASLDIELGWIDEHVQGRPYGVDLLVPTSMDSKEAALDAQHLEARIPQEHRDYITQLLASHGIDTADLWSHAFGNNVGDNMRASGALPVLEVACSHPIAMVVNALGVPPAFMFDLARERNILVGALTGAKEHAVKHAEAGVDVLVVAGTEAGGHCGEVSTLVLVPEVLEALDSRRDQHFVLAAGGIVTGRQMAAAMAMGADGAWCGSVWLTTSEAETVPVVKEKMLAASSRQTVRSRSRTGKYTRQLRSAWTDAWQAPDAPEPLPMPLQGVLAETAFRKINKLARAGDPGAGQLANYFVGQGVGLMNEPLSTRQVVYSFKEDFAEACERAGGLVAD